MSIIMEEDDLTMDRVGEGDCLERVGVDGGSRMILALPWALPMAWVLVLPMALRLPNLGSESKLKLTISSTSESTMAVWWPWALPWALLLALANISAVFWGGTWYLGGGGCVF